MHFVKQSDYAHFESPWHGSCYLCWDVIRPGDLLVSKQFRELDIEFSKQVHLECQVNLVNSCLNGGDQELAQYEHATVEHEQPKAA